MIFSRVLTLTALLVTSASSLFADCFQSVEFGVGWRRDDLKWKVNRMEGSGVSAVAASHIDFKDIESYTAHAQAKWTDKCYYIRLSADYGLADKGRAKEHFLIDSSILGYSVLETHVNDPVKRRSESYDFNGAVGYPFTFQCCRLLVAPLIGFSFHRQHIKVKQHEDRSFNSYFSLESSSNPFGVSSSSDLISDSSSFSNSPSSSSSSSDYFDPFESYSHSNIASLIGFSPERRTSNYRFSWYGFYLGADIAYALDGCWTLFSELEYHFCDRSHAKRKSYTAVDFVDDYHSEHWAHGVNATLGTTFSMSNCWFSTLAVDFKWWQSKGDHHDSLQWKTTGIHITLGYMF